MHGDCISDTSLALLFEIGVVILRNVITLRKSTFNFNKAKKTKRPDPKRDLAKYSPMPADVNYFIPKSPKWIFRKRTMQPF
jgi:hypothetical protein